MSANQTPQRRSLATAYCTLRDENAELVAALDAVCDAYGCECVEGAPANHCPMCLGRAAIAKATGAQS